MIKAVLILILIFISLTPLFFMVRIELVHRERMRLLGLMDFKINQNIFNKQEWRWRYEEYEKISFNEMIFKFWKPIKSFYQLDRLLRDNK